MVAYKRIKSVPETLLIRWRIVFNQRSRTTAEAAVQ